MQSIIYLEINLFCVLILTMLGLHIRRSMFLQTHRRLLFGVILSNMVFFALDLCWICIDRQFFTITILINWILNVMYFIVSALVSVFWFAYSETLQDSRIIKNRRWFCLCMIPAALLVILSLFSLKTGWLFYIDSQNIYRRGPFYPLQIFCSYGYVIFTASKAFYHSLHTDNYRRKREFRILASFVIPTLITGTMQTFIPGLPILCIGNTLGILYTYLNMQEQLISIDPLTRLNNRNQLYQYLYSKVHHLNEKKSLYLMIMDIDYFKSINDRFGHVEGDHALQLTAKCLMKVCSSHNYFLCRFGGDEFIILCELNPEADIETVCTAIHAELKNANTPYKLSMSIGYTQYTTDFKNQQEFIGAADAKLYEAKQNRP